MTARIATREVCLRPGCGRLSIIGNGGRCLKFCSIECRYLSQKGRPIGATERIEPLDSPRWMPRIRKAYKFLAEHGPMSTGRLVPSLAKAQGWSEQRTINVLAAGHPLFVECTGIWTVACKR